MDRRTNCIDEAFDAVTGLGRRSNGYGAAMLADREIVTDGVQLTLHEHRGRRPISWKEAGSIVAPMVVDDTLGGDRTLDILMSAFVGSSAAGSP